MDNICTTYVATARSCDAALLDSQTAMAVCIDETIVAARLHQIDRLTHQFSPQGLSAIALLAESHLALHTWPENGTAYVTLTTCGDTGSDFSSVLQKIIAKTFLTDDVSIQEVRG